jgi:alkylated DNA repair dioxygenase AlkB
LSSDQVSGRESLDRLPFALQCAWSLECHVQYCVGTGLISKALSAHNKSAQRFTAKSKICEGNLRLAWEISKLRIRREKLVQDGVHGFLSREEADALLDRIRSEADFKQNYIQLYGRKAIPRLEAWYGSWDYPYSKGVVLKAAPMPDYLRDVIGKIEAAGFGSFNAILINRYHDGKDYISPHSDDDYGDAEPTIPSLTLGAARPFPGQPRAAFARARPC